MKVAIVGADAILRHKITETIKEYEIVGYVIDDVRVSLNESPEILNGIPGQDWRGKGKQKMRRQR
ncbi:hypothetical protein [uncultured Amphritea sp.]|uniref:hypothetical protein n=1 Tax=uncultured Amphritea sp. TaxID=981605 RepID=UPI002629F46D|nr:hypothetical protein [uncultured Amphritea sp.]